MTRDYGSGESLRTRHLGDTERTKREVLCAEAGADLPHLGAEARHWQALTARCGLRPDILLDLLSSHAVRWPCLGAAVERVRRELQCLDIRCDREDPDVAQVRL